MIIDDHDGELTCDAKFEPLPADSVLGLAHQLPVGLDTLPDDDEEEANECGDQVAPLPDAGKPKTNTQKLREERSHIVLLVDASGSMRTEDVECIDGAGSSPGLTNRLDAALTCAVDFASTHARLHPTDVFSVVAISDTATLLTKAVGADGAREALADCALRAAGGTFYTPALATATQCLDEHPCVAGHVVMLSDGRPADTKAALDFFQAQFIHGRHASSRLHGIAFGSTVENSAPLQQLACISGGTFTLTGCSIRSLCDAFTSVSSSITSFKDESAASHGPLTVKRTLRQLNFEHPGLGVFGKKGVLRFSAARSAFRYDGQAFQKQEWAAGFVERRTSPHMRGGMRLVFGFRDPQVVTSDGGWMVAKTSRFLDQEFNTTPVVEAHAKSTAVARHFAVLFNAQAQAAPEKDGGCSPSVIFVPCFVYNVQEAGKPSQYGPEEPCAFAAERYLPGVFMKYNSNNGYVSEGSIRHHEVIQAFLHFTFVRSGGTLLVADLQGVAREAEALLTDPQVLTLAGGTFGPGDIGARGMRACLAAHRCGLMCKRLGLKPISGPILRRLQAAAPATAPARRAPGSVAQSSVLSTGSWERLGSENAVSSCDSTAAYVATPDAEWERVSEHNVFSGAASESVRSSQASSSSWVHLLDT